MLLPVGTKKEDFLEGQFAYPEEKEGGFLEGQFAYPGDKEGGGGQFAYPRDKEGGLPGGPVRGQTRRTSWRAT